MESSSGEDLQRDEHGDRQPRIIPLGHPENESECSTVRETIVPAFEKGDQFFTASADSVCIMAADGIASTSEPGRPSPSSRIQEMIESKSGFSNEQDFEIYHSATHWSELQPSKGECSDNLTDEYLRERNRKSYIALRRTCNAYDHGSYQRDVRSFFNRENEKYSLGKKIAQGGQGEIFEAGSRFVTKLFNLDFSPEAVITRGLLDHVEFFDNPRHRVGSHLVAASLVEDENSQIDGRFCIVMRRCWGDLRKLIDQRMMGSNNLRPPFTTKQVLWLMHAIAYDMWCLHKHSILHRDLKASNVLLEGLESPSLDMHGNYKLIVADYESSDGVVGTGFWRAPEILQQLKDRKPGTEFVLKFTEECDVYSFGMTCYELVTGRIPFEGYGQSNYDLVLSGRRPELPGDVDPLVRGIMTSCWHPDPSQRPTFLDICSLVANSRAGRHMSGAKHGHNGTLDEGAQQTNALHHIDASQMIRDFMGMFNGLANFGAKLWPERFWEKSGFVIPKYWGDLRMLIDKLTRPHWADGKVDRYLVPDPGVGFIALDTKQDLQLMHAIARAMCGLHKEEPPIIYGNLEASNVLVYGNRSCPSLDEDGNYMVTVADYKSLTHFKCFSKNRIVTSYTEIWLAPETMQHFSWVPEDVVVTKECDVYSYGMTCYELVTGRTPFANEFDIFRKDGLLTHDLRIRYADRHRLKLRKKILDGRRPELPADLDPLIKEIITSCWDHDPSQRPTFMDICNRIASSPGFQPSSSSSH